MSILLAGPHLSSAKAIFIDSNSRHTSQNNCCELNLQGILLQLDTDY